MRSHRSHRIIVTLLLLTAAACTKTESGQGEAAPEGQRSAAGASPAIDTGGMQSMTGMNDMSGQRGTADSTMSAMPTEMRTHVAAMTGATAATLTTMLPKHRQLVANMIARMNGEMRAMQMASDGEWSATVDSLRADLVQLPNLSGAELTAVMPTHLTRVRRLNTMHAGMMRGMAK